MGCGNEKAVGTGDDKFSIVFVIGGPGSGKGTQCKKIKDEFHYEHLSTGDILRSIVEKKENPKWEELDKTMKEGGFVSSADLVGFIKDYIKDLPNKKILLDGYPRNQENVDEWDKSMNDTAELKAVLYFNCSPEEMTKRMLGRNEGRADDNEETMKKRIENFTNQTMPLIENYKSANLLIEIDAMRGVDEIFEDVKKAFTEKNL